MEKLAPGPADGTESLTSPCCAAGATEGRDVRRRDPVAAGLLDRVDGAVIRAAACRCGTAGIPRPAGACPAGIPRQRGRESRATRTVSSSVAGRVQDTDLFQIELVVMIACGRDATQSRWQDVAISGRLAVVVGDPSSRSTGSSARTSPCFWTLGNGRSTTGRRSTPTWLLAGVGILGPRESCCF